MNNAIFGKSIENLRNRSDLHLTVDGNNAVKWFSKLNFKNSDYQDGLYLIQTFKEKVVLDKPIYILVVQS